MTLAPTVKPPALATLNVVNIEIAPARIGYVYHQPPAIARKAKRAYNRQVLRAAVRAGQRDPSTARF
jgi:hypothetical protein